MHLSSASADLPGIAYLAVLLRQNCFFIAIFPAELRGTTAHLRRLPRKGRAGGAKNLCSSIACRAQPCQRCTAVQQALIIFQMHLLRLCFGRAVFCCPGSTERSIQQSAPTPVLERGRFVCEGLQPEGCMRNRRLGHISQSDPAQSVRRCKAGKHRFVKGGEARLSALRFCRSGWRTRQ